MPVGKQVVVRHRNENKVEKVGESRSQRAFHATISSMKRIHLETSHGGGM